MSVYISVELRQQIPGFDDGRYVHYQSAEALMGGMFGIVMLTFLTA